MKQFIFLFSLIFLSTFIFVTPVFAQSSVDPTTSQISKQTLHNLNPLNLPGVDAGATKDFSTPGGIISRVLAFGIPLAGLILFVMIIWGGFEMLSSSASAKSKDAGRNRVTAALTGFILLFASYWIIQIIQLIFKVSIISSYP